MIKVLENLYDLRDASVSPRFLSDLPRLEADCATSKTKIKILALLCR